MTMTGLDDAALHGMLWVATAQFPRERLAVLEGELRIMLRREPSGTAAANLLCLAQEVLAEMRAPRH